MQGVSGAGKSTLARKLVRTVSSRGAYAQIVSADDFFCDSSGAYNFDPAKLGEAHDACFRKFLKFLMYERTELIVVDNTNTQAVQIAPYVLAATALGFRAKILHRIFTGARVLNTDLRVGRPGRGRENRTLVSSQSKKRSTTELCP